MQSTHVTPPETGTLVFSSDGEEIGEITEIHPEYVHVKKGLIFRKEVYVPLSAIVGTALGGDGVQVNLTKAELESGDWDQPPVSSGTEGTADVGVGAAEHNTMGATTPYGTEGASAPAAFSDPGTPPEGAENTFDDGTEVGARRDDTDISQRPEAEAHYAGNDDTTRP